MKSSEFPVPSSESANENFSIKPGTWNLELGTRRLARLTAAAAFLLLIAGGLVTSTGSSLSVPDWPLSYGTLLPRMEGGVVFEHSHRLIAGTVALLTFLLAFLLRKKGTRGPARTFAYAAAAGILLQAVLGGVTVLMRLPPPISIAHACLGQIVFCLLLATADALGDRNHQAVTPAETGVQVHSRLDSRLRENDDDISRPSPLTYWGIAATGAIFLQLLLGAVFRHTDEGFPLHAAWAAVTSVLILGLVYLSVFSKHSRNFSVPGLLERPALLLAVLLPCQLLLGLMAWQIRISPDFARTIALSAVLPTAHVVCGALILGTAFLWTLRTSRAD